MTNTQSLVLISTLLLLAVPANADTFRKQVSVFLEKALSKSDCSTNENVARFAGLPLLVGFEGTSLKPDLERKIRTLHPGGIILFSKNISNQEQLKGLIAEAQELSLRESGRKLLVAIDQEGGEVSRIKVNPPLPSALSIGLLGDASVAKHLGHYTGRILNDLGVNMNLAPVLDLADHDQSSFIGTRSYGADPNLVSIVANEYAAGLIAHGVLPTFKHFPGHGNTMTDSHRSQFRKHIGLSTLLERDLVPFKYVFNHLPFSAVMSAHIGFPDFDSTGMPASFSPVILKDVLRSVMEFRGLIVSDDLQMQGAKISGNAGDRAVRSLKAGADVLIFAWNYKDQWDAFQGIRSEMCDNFSFAMDQSAKTHRMGKALALENFGHASAKKDKIDHSEDAYERTILGLYDQLISRGFDLLSLEDWLGSNNKIAILSNSVHFLKEADQDLNYPKRLILFDETTAATDVHRVLSQRKQDLLLFYNSSGKTTSLLSKLRQDIKKRTIVINSLHPTRISGIENYLGVLQIGSHNPNIGKLIAHQMNHHILRRGDWKVKSRLGGFFGAN
ncbi:MAG: beta-N-acetylhexosaminidase [Bdellovibrionales bacterium]|nr:beta-N-acetylhexosaminidase [Bdellovibrionales bacterium]